MTEPAPSPRSPDGLTMSEILGVTLMTDASWQQRETIAAAITENAAGVKQIADWIRRDQTLANPRIARPVPFLLSKLGQGAHRLRAVRTDGPKRTEPRVSPVSDIDPDLAALNAARARAWLEQHGHRPKPAQPASDEDAPIVVRP